MFHRILAAKIPKVEFIVFSATLLLSGQASAHTGQNIRSLTPTQVQRLSSGLFRPNSQDFFSQGQERIKREILLLEQRYPAAAKPLLRGNEVPQVGKKR